MTEIEKTEGEIKVLQAKLELLKEMENHKSPAEEAFKRVYYRYPDKLDVEHGVWDIFEKGYNASKEDCKVEEEPEAEPKTLTDILYLWWSDVFTTHSDWDMETSIDDLVTRIEEWWLPKEQSAEGSQNTFAIDATEGFNHCLNKIKGTLR
jgi:hypothetical protein